MLQKQNSRVIEKSLCIPAFVAYNSPTLEHNLFRGRAMNRLSKLAEQLIDTHWRRAAVVGASFVVAAGLKHALVGAMLHFEVARVYLRVQDALITGALTALIVWALLAGIGIRRRYVQRQSQVVADLNHDLRNALQVILGSEYLPKTEEATAILESVERINRNLSMLLSRPADRVQRDESDECDFRVDSTDL